MLAIVALLSWDVTPSGPSGGARLRALVDVCFPCNLACEGCTRGRQRGLPNRAAACAVAERLAALCALERVDAVSAVFYGGEPLLDVDALCAAVSSVRDACGEAGRGFEASVVSNGLLLDVVSAERLGRAGVSAIQIGFPAVAATDAPGLQQMALAVRNARAARDTLEVLLRVEMDGPGGLGSALEVVSRLDREGLLAPPRPAAVLLGARASYADQARALLAAPLLHRAALAARRGGAQGPGASPMIR
jgi:hypothetical protein